ncbi:hypothetical protein TSUD_11840 [Trifolium subterraneum]|uniref:Non-haem dioxygenase N-terminal domain-containing protein n=1 Tax=Trifolium subterraneum TaxID=3900 RepID=A0A2Z6MDG1_TRISU|nr:hypothetical protein TSUD_11840 [Trifolium subterraneum]
MSMSSPIATPSQPPPTTTSPPYDRLKAVKQFDETKAGVKGLIDSGIKTIPSIFIHPPETLSDLAPGSGPEPEIPIIDLSVVHSSHATVVDQIRNAASTVGFFQVINHGISLELMRSVIGAMKAFHEQPADVRAQLKMGPVAADEKEIPEVCRKEVMEWDREVVRVGDILLGLLSEGLGLGAERLAELGLSQGRMVSNEDYKSADHRVLANPSNEPRVSIAVFLNPGDREKLFGPLPELTSEQKPALYRDFTLNEFMTRYVVE